MAMSSRQAGIAFTLLGLIGAAVGIGLWLYPPAPTPPPPPPHPPVTDPDPTPSAHSTPPPTPEPLPLGAYLSEQEFFEVLRKTGAMYIVVAVSAPDSDPSVAQTLELIEWTRDLKPLHTALIGITQAEDPLGAEKFVRQTGTPQAFALYRAPWFGAKYSLEQTPCLYLFQADGTPLYKASPGSEPVLSQIKRRVQSLVDSSGDPAVNPRLADDPHALEDAWTRKQIQGYIDRLPALAASLSPVINDLPTEAAGVEQLTPRYRATMKATRAVYGWVQKSWPGTPDPHWVKISMTDDEATRLGPPEGTARWIGQGRMVDHIGDKPVHAEFQMVFETATGRPLMQVLFDSLPVAVGDIPADAPIERKTAARFELWFTVEPPPDSLQSFWANPQRP